MAKGYIIEQANSMPKRYAKHYDGTDTGWTTDKSEAKIYTRKEIEEIYKNMRHKFMYVIREFDYDPIEDE